MGHLPQFVTFFICPSLSVSPSVKHHISKTVHHVVIIFGTHVYNNDISRHFFHFFKILIFWVVRGVKGQKIAQNEKEKLHLSDVVSQEQCSIWSCLIHLFKMMISAAIFFYYYYYFKILIFLVVKGVKGQKMVQDGPDILSIMLYISGTIHHMIVIYATHV